MKFSSDVKPELIRGLLGAGLDLVKDKLFMILTDGIQEISGKGYERQPLKDTKWENGVFSSSSCIFKAEGGQWRAKSWVVVNDSMGGRKLFSGLIDPSGNEVLITDGNTLTIANPNGFFSLR